MDHPVYYTNYIPSCEYINHESTCPRWNNRHAQQYTYYNILVDTCLCPYRNNFISARVDLFNVVPIHIKVKIVLEIFTTTLRNITPRYFQISEYIPIYNNILII